MDAVGYYGRNLPLRWWGSEPEYGRTRETWGQTDWASLTAVALEREYVEQGIAVKILRPGLIAVDITDDRNIAQLFLQRGDDILDDVLDVNAIQIRHLNALSVCIHSGVLTEMQIDIGPTLVTAENMLKFHYAEDGQFSGVGGQRSSEIAEILGDSARMGVIDSGALELGLDKFGEVLRSSSPEAVGLIALLNEAVCAYKQHNFPLAVVAAWSICERLQSIAWADYYEGAATAGRIRLNKDKRKDLSSGRDFTASIVATVLQLAGVISVDLWEKLRAARNARNGWLHSGKRPGRVDASECIEAAITMLDRVLRFNISVGGAISVNL